MRILLGYSHYPNPVDVGGWVAGWMDRLHAYGFDVSAFCLTPHPPRTHYKWPELDARWKRGDRDLMTMYEDLAHAMEGYDVFVNWNGVNLHPDFVRQMPIFKVYGCYDDPESSEDLSKPVAASYDLAMVGNVAELETYRSWGVKNVKPWPLGFRGDDCDPNLTKEKILTGSRDVDITLLCERVSGWRAERLDRLVAAFPKGRYHGRGWPAGFLPDRERVPLYQRTKIGLNFHNSTGPINFRTFILPANGVMQVCDNKSHLGMLYELGKEVVGFDHVDEALELCRYYLAHDDERRRIAAAGWERATKDYNEKACFQRLVDAVNEHRPKSARGSLPAAPRLFLEAHASATAWRRALHQILDALGILFMLQAARKVIRRLGRKS